jgi:hypothetical protein
MYPSGVEETLPDLARAAAPRLAIGVTAPVLVNQCRSRLVKRRNGDGGLVAGFDCERSRDALGPGTTDIYDKPPGSGIEGNEAS